MNAPSAAPRPDAGNRSRTTRVLDVLTPIGNLLVAQLIFLGCSLTVVLLLPAAVALQRTAEAILVDHENAVLRRFLTELGPAIRRYLLIGLAVDLVAAMLGISLFFWAAAEGPLRFAALAMLILLGGLLTAGYLCALAESVADHDRVRHWLHSAYRRLLSRPLLAAGGVVIMVTWFLLLARLPTLSLVGTGLVPALLAYGLRHLPDRR